MCFVIVLIVSGYLKCGHFGSVEKCGIICVEVGNYSTLLQSEVFEFIV